MDLGQGEARGNKTHQSGMGTEAGERMGEQQVAEPSRYTHPPPNVPIKAVNCSRSV